MTDNIMNKKLKKLNLKKDLPKYNLKEIKIGKLKTTKKMSKISTLIKTKQTGKRRPQIMINKKLGVVPKIKKFNNLKGYIKNPKNTGFNRIKQQKFLKPMKDFDGDGLINMLDCNPRNKFKQGPAHELEDDIMLTRQRGSLKAGRADRDVSRQSFKSERFVSETPQISPERTLEDKLVPSDELRRSFTEDVNNKEKETSLKIQLEKQRKNLEMLEKEKKPSRIERLKGFVGEKSKEFKGFVGGIAQEERAAKQSRTERDAEFFAKAREKADKEEEKQRVKILALQLRQARRGDTKGPVRREAAKARQALGTIPGAFATISTVAAGQRGFGVSQPVLAGGGAAKIMALLGKPIPVQQQQQVSGQPCATPVQDAQASTERGVQSPYSKRKVSYVRGPYKKG